MSQTASPRAARIMATLKRSAAELSGYGEDELIEDRTFLELGFDSLFLTQLAATFQNEFKLKITFRQLFDELPTLAALASHIDGKLPPEAEPEPAPAPQPAAAPEPVAEQSAPAPMAPVMAAPDPSVLFDPPATAPAAPAMAPPVDGTTEAIFAEQLSLMSRQLDLLMRARGQSVAAVEGHSAAAGDPVGDVGSAFPPTAPPVVPPDALPDDTPAATTPPPEAAQAETTRMPAGFGLEVSDDDEALTPRQRVHLERLTARYNAKTARSKAQAQAHRRHHADPRMAAGFNRLWKEMVYQIVVEESKGCYLKDIDGNRYIDMLNGFGPNYLGHSTPFVSEALKEQIDKGIEVGPQTPLAGEAAALFCEMTGMDRVSWVNTGSEAVQAAIRLSRTYTGRNKIVLFAGDYHGNFDEVLVRVNKTSAGRRTMPLAPGIPLRAVSDVIVLDYGDEGALDVIKENADDIAAVLVEPVQSRRPELQPREFLHALRALTEDEEIVLVFDEVITGFRMCPGGAQEFYGVRADLATYGKIIGGGMPIGVVAGRAELMDTFDGGMWQYGDDSFPSAGVTFFAGTFVRHPLAIASVYATLKYLKAAGPQLQMRVNQMTSRLVGELNRFFEARGVKIHIAHCASQMYIRVEEENELATLLFYHLRDRGIHVLEGFPTYMTAAHTDADVDQIVAAFKDSVLEMQDDGVLPRPPGETALPGNWRREMPLTDAQREVWIAAQMSELASCAFNESDSLRITGAIDLDKFRAAVIATLAHHEAFRLRIDYEGEHQWVEPNPVFEMPLVALDTDTGKPSQDRLMELLAVEACSPFDLENGPLVRVALYRLGEDDHVFTIYCHHIAFDGYSAELVVRELAERYTALVEGRAAEVAETEPYSLYVYKNLSPANGEAQAASLEYWMGVFGGEVPMALELPGDRPRGATRTYGGGTVHRELDREWSQSVIAAAKACGTSQHTFLLSGFSTLMSRLSAQEDLVIGVPAAGQARTGIDTVGYCVTALPVRTEPAHDMAFVEFAGRTQRAVLDAFEHQETGLGELVRALGIPRDPSRLPLVEVIFNYSRYFADIKMPGCQVSSRENRRAAVYYDLFFNIVEADGRFVIDWDYASDLFDAATIERWIDHYVQILTGVVADPETMIGHLPLMSAEEARNVIAGWDAGAAEK